MRLLTALPFYLLLNCAAALADDSPDLMDPGALPQGGQARINVSRPQAQNENACDVGLYVQNKLIARLAPGDQLEIPVPSGQVAIGVASMGSALCKDEADMIHGQSVLLQPGETRGYRVNGDQSGVFLSPLP